MDEDLKLGCNILHLEDDDNDSWFFERILARLGFAGRYRRTATVPETISYLTQAEVHANPLLFPRPDILVVDSVLSGGQTTLNLTDWLAEQEQFDDLTRIVLSSDMSKAEQEKWLTRGVSAVFLKGSNLEDLTLSVKKILRHCAAQPS